MTVYFDHEKLDVYNKAILFVAWVDSVLQVLPAKVAVKDQLDRASTSIPLNIAEGNGKYSIKDRTRFLEFSYGSAVECAACLDVIVAKKLMTPPDVEDGKRQLKEIVSMLVGLINSLANRVREESADYVFESAER